MTVKGLHAVVYTRDGVTHWSLSDGRSGTDPYPSRLHPTHPLLQADTLEDVKAHFNPEPDLDIR